MLVRAGAGIYDLLLREGVIVRPMGGFGLPEHVRITIGHARGERAAALCAAEGEGERVSDPVFERVAVVGLGLLGGSVAAAARARGVARRVVGVARQRETAAEALRAGIVDEAGIELEALVEGADLLVLATPLGAMPEVLRRAAPRLAEGCIVTDVGSVKGSLGETLAGLLPPGVLYVGAHPMAGSHRRGLDHARADLFEGASCVVAPAQGTPPGRGRASGRLLRGARRARRCERDPADHDRRGRAGSAICPTRSPSPTPTPSRTPPPAPPPCADRASATSPASRTAIPSSGPRSCAATARPWPGPLARAGARLAELARAIEQGDGEAVERFLAAARESLARPADDARSGGAKPEISVRKEH